MGSTPLFELKRVILCRADHPSLSELRETPEHWPQILKKHPTVSVSRFEERDFPSMDSGLLAESIQDSAMLRVYSIATALGVLKETDALAICGFTAGIRSNVWSMISLLNCQMASAAPSRVSP